MEQIQKFSAELQVTPDTPQAFIALTSDDPSVAPYHGVNYYLALQKNKVPATLHVYPTGGLAGDFRIILNISNMDTGVGEMVARRRCIPGKPRTHVTNREILPGN